MPVFSASYDYSPILVLMLGLCTLSGVAGVGWLGLYCFRLTLSSPWKQVVSILLGVQIVSLVVQLLGMSSLSSPQVLSALGWMVAIAGTVLSRNLVDGIIPYLLAKLNRWQWLAFIATIGVLAVNLLVAIAPSTKHDEVYYHMLLPSRIVADGVLNYYQEPWQSGILPQMIVQIAASPLHAMGAPDAFNVVSWGCSASLVWLGGFLTLQYTQNIERALGGSCVLAVGMYSIVWQTTGGAHAYGDLATTTATVALLNGKHFCHRQGIWAFGGVLSIATLAAVSTKITLYPLALTMVAIALGIIYSLAANRSIWQQTYIGMAGTWLLFMAPIVAWTWTQSGSPLGPILNSSPDELLQGVRGWGFGSQPFSAIAMGVLSPSVFSEAWGHFVWSFNTNSLQYSPLVLVAGVVYVLCRDIHRQARAIALTLLILQTTIVGLFLFSGLRFYGGLLQGLVIALCMQAPTIDPFNMAAKQLQIFCLLVLTVPWLCVQIIFSGLFVPVSLGLQPSQDFYAHRVGLYTDFQRIDQQLPADAKLLVNERIEDIRVSAAYAPRRIYLTPADLPDTQQLYLLTLTGEDDSEDETPLPASCHVGQSVYRNSQSTLLAYRSPGRDPELGSVEVNAIDCDGEA